MKKLLLFGAIALSTATFAQMPNYVPTNGLVGWWPFNGNANDESGNGNNGTVNGATLTSDRFGNSNQAYSFDGVSNFIQISNSTSLNFNVGTINIWFYSSLTNSMALIERNIYLNASNENWALDLNEPATGDLSLFTKHNSNCLAGNGWQANTANQNSLINNWHMFTGVIKNSTTEIYFDGILVNTFNTISSMDVCGGDIQIARHWLNEPRYFSGKIDDIGIWNRALTQCEIQDLYNAQLNSATGIDAGPDQTVCDGNSITLSGAGGTNYIWNNTIVDGVPFVPTATIDYTLFGEDANGCIGTDTMHVEVIPNSTSTQTETALDSYTWPINNQSYTQSGTYTAVIPNAAGCDSTITLNLTLDFTGIDENGANFLAVYPNPTTSMFTIEGEWIVNKEYTLVDIQGRIVLNGTFKSNKETIDLKTIARGQYMLRVEGKELKVIKE